MGQEPSMDVFYRLSKLRGAAKEHASPVWESASAHLWRGWLWLTVPRDPVDWKGVLANARTWLQLRTIASRVIAGVVFAALLTGAGVVFVWSWDADQANRAPLLAPLASIVGTLATLAVGVFLARAALRQARIATLVAEIAAQQADTAGRRHVEQTKSDFRRRITESFSKAVEQLASDKLEARLGGIYTLERISIESADDYWTVMETLTACLRERSQRNDAEYQKSDERISPRARALWEERGRPEGKADEIWEEAVWLGEPPAADIDAILTVIKRRREQSRVRERAEEWRLDLTTAVLKQANLKKAHLERAWLQGAHLEGAALGEARLEEANLGNAHLKRAWLQGAHLEGADLTEARLEEANLGNAHLKKALLSGAHLEWANLQAAHLEGAILYKAYLERADFSYVDLGGADLRGAHLEGTNLSDANLSGAQLRGAHLGFADLSRATVAQPQLDEACGVDATLPAGLTLKPCP
jgi:uncharacterized protein YjbI with pentapeptide repeats